VITKKIIELKRISLEALQRAMNLETAGNWEAAVRAYAEFIERYGDAPEADMAYYRKGHVEMVSLKNHRAAVESFQRLLARYPDAMTRAEAYFGLAQAYRSLGDTAKARETLDFLVRKYGDTMAAEEARKVKW